MDLEESLDVQIPQIQASAIANATETKKKASDALTMLFPVDGVGVAYRLSQRQRVFVSVQKLKELKGSKCLHVLDNGSVCYGVLDYALDLKGSIVQFRCCCPYKHSGLWVSSEVIGTSHHQDIYLNYLLIGACFQLSGNNYSKFQLLCKFLRLVVPDRSVVCRNQRLFYLPVIPTMWDDKLLETNF